jgi:hypothetical protein
MAVEVATENAHWMVTASSAYHIQPEAAAAGGTTGAVAAVLVSATVSM